MFDGIMREIRKLSQPRQISIDLPLDEKGYFDRVCPSGSCGGPFKVLFDDWGDKVSDEVVYCPFCRHEAPSDEWHTDDQQRYIESAARAEMGRLLNDALRRGVQQSRPMRSRGGLIDISMSLSYKPGSIPPVVPAKARAELQQDFTCEVCGCRYASLGASFFCPACGHNSAESSFDTTLKTVRTAVQSSETVRAVIEQEHNADVAHDAVRQILEDQFPRLVGAFERLNEALFAKLPNAGQVTKRGSVFQRVDDASALWRQSAGKGFGDFLSAGELQRLKVLVQRRHVFSHQQGIVDQAYIDRSGDRTYSVGQRLVVRGADVLELVELLAKLTAGLRGLI